MSSLIWYLMASSVLIPGGGTIFQFLRNSQEIGRGLLNTFELFTRQCTENRPFRLLQLDNVTAVRNVVKIVHFTDTGQYNYRVNSAADRVVASADYDKDLTTVIYVYGYLNSPYSDNSETLAANFLKRGGSNVLVFDSSIYMSLPYELASSMVPNIGTVLSQFLQNLTDRGVSPKNIHIIGYSLGAHIGGVAGRELRKRTARQIARITGLDPARPCFSSAKSRRYRLGKKDAGYVDVLHTNPGILGVMEPTGDVDLYAYGTGGIQPGCSSRLLSCSHSRSWQLYAESVDNDYALYARKCKNWGQLKSNNCTGLKIRAGYSLPRNSKGLYLMKHT